MQKLLEVEEEIKDLTPLHGKRKTYKDEIKVLLENT